MLISAPKASQLNPTGELIIFIHLILLVFSETVQMSQDHCYSDIGCFPLLQEFYHPRHRPFNVRPWHRRRIKTQFEIFNRQHPRGFMMVPWNKLNLEQSHFDSMLETKVIIPGWLDNVKRTVWIKKMRDSFMWLWAPVNVIIVRWVNFTPYTIATANTRVVGAELANFIKFLEHELYYDRAYYHIIGHSLGAHIGGYTGDRLPGLGRITALDPARPFFQGMPKSVRLDRGDAKFVDAIHSDFTPENAILLLMSFGMSKPVGHLDFYPNGPPLLQPGCLRDGLTSVRDGIVRGLQHGSLSVAFLEAIRYLTACDHQRSHEWFIESITNRQCMFVGVRCSEFEGLINGRCTCDDSRSACAIMGIHADQMYMHGVHDDLWPVSHNGNTKRALGRNFRAAPNTVANNYQFEFETQLPARSVDYADSLELPNEFVTTNAPLEEFGTHNNWLETFTEPQRPPTREEIYSRLKQQIDELSQRPPAMGFAHLKASSLLARSSSALENITTSQTKEDQLEGQASEQIGSVHQGATKSRDADQSTEQQLRLALDDVTFVRFLQSNLLLEDSTVNAKNLFGAGSSVAEKENRLNSSSPVRRELKQQETTLGHFAQFAGHPNLMSSMHRDTENWYEGTSRWFLKTNNKPYYCANQYQLLLFLGPLNTMSGRDRLRANLIVSLIGTRGQLLNQRFVPRGATLNSFTMQPFFILLESSYSLGQIHSVAVAWEARNDPDPIQATISFQSNPALEALQSKLPAYQTKNNPWVARTRRYNKSRAFQWTTNNLQLQLGKLILERQKRDMRAKPTLQIGYNRRLLKQVPESSEPIQQERRFPKNNGLKKRLGLGLSDYEEPILDQVPMLDYEDDVRTLEPAAAGQHLNIQREEQFKLKQKQFIADHDEPFLAPLVNPTPVDQLVPINGLSVEDAFAQLDPQTVLHLHNLNTLTKEAQIREDTIVINQVIVSPIQATYGRYGRNARTFCPPGRVGQKLGREQTIKLTASLFGRCHTGSVAIPKY